MQEVQRTLRLRLQHGQFGHVVVAFDQRGHRPEPGNGAFVQRPHGLVDCTAMVVDQQPVAGGITVLGEAGQVDLAHGPRGQRLDQRVDQQPGVAAVVDAADVGVVHVQQQRAAGAAHDGGQEAGLVHGRAGVAEVGAGVFQQQRAPQPRLHLVDVVAHTVQCGGVVGQRQQVVEPAAAMAGPGQVFAEPAGFEAPEKVVQPVEVINIQRAFTTDRQAHAVDGQRPVRAHPFQLPQHRAAVDHVVLGMHLHEAGAAEERARSARQQRRHVGHLEAHACEHGRRAGWRGHDCRCVDRGAGPCGAGGDQAFFSLNSFNWPKPEAEDLLAVFSQVPLATSFQALPWKSRVLVPAQVVPGPAAQSFLPLSATPKHFSLSAGWACAGAWARARADPTARARAAACDEVGLDRDMGSLLVG
jgi:hypothetical protein